jgi:hypothetical protein
MNRVIKIYRLIGLVAIFGLSNTAYAVCSFDPNVPSGYVAPDGSTTLSGQGNFVCLNVNGKNGQPMTEVTGVVFQRSGDWEMPQSEWVTDANGFVTNTPDRIFLFPGGKGSRCEFLYVTNNAVKGTGLDNDGNVDPNDSVACTDGLVNVEEVILPELDLVTTTEDGCNVTLTAATPNGTVTESDFDIFTGSSLDGSIQAVCSAGGITQFECVRACPEFLNVEERQDMGYCQSDSGGWIPLYDNGIPDAFSTNKRCTPCLTATEATAVTPGFDTDGLKLCWQHTNSVNSVPGKYRAHKAVRSQTTETKHFNECYETTTTVNFFGREITKTITTCD